MILGLGLIELASIYKTLKINNNSYVDMIIEISKRGYKLDYNKYLELNNGEDGIDTNISVKTTNRLTMLSMLIPGINMLYAHHKKKKIIDVFMKNEIISKSLVKFTKEEEEKFKSLNTKDDQFFYTMFLITKKYDEEVYVPIEGQKIATIYSIDMGRQYLSYDSLMNLSYTLNDVKRINSVKNGKYKLGTVNGINIAIIGIDFDDELDMKMMYDSFDEIVFKRVSFIRDNFEEIYDFCEMTEEEAKDKRFVIYPYNKCDDYDKEVDKIIMERDNNRKQCNQTIINYVKPKKLTLSNRR